MEQQFHLLVKKIENHESLVSNLQKNNHLTNYAAFNRSMFKLTESITELQRLMTILKQPIEPIFTKKDYQKQSLIFQYKQLIEILNLIWGKNSKKAKKLRLSDKKLENIEDKQLLRVVQNTILYTNSLCGFSMESLKKVSSKYIAAKFNKAKQLSEEYGLTQDRLQKLESSSILFIKSMIEVDLASKEQEKSIRRINKLLDLNEKVFKRKTDKFVELYEKTDSNFSKTYKGLRFIEKLDKKEKQSTKKKGEREELA